jgi:hypothetical protein
MNLGQIGSFVVSIYWQRSAVGPNPRRMMAIGNRNALTLYTTRPDTRFIAACASNRSCRTIPILAVGQESLRPAVPIRDRKNVCDEALSRALRFGGYANG